MVVRSGLFKTRDWRNLEKSRNLIYSLDFERPLLLSSDKFEEGKEF